MAGLPTDQSSRRQETQEVPPRAHLTCSAPAEARWALLQEGGASLAVVSRGGAGGDRLRLVLHLRLEALVPAGAQQLLRAAKGERRALCQLRGEFGRLDVELVVVHDAVDDAPVLG